MRDERRPAAGGQRTTCEVRRALGYKLARPEKLLAQFISYLEQAGAVTVTTEHALAWAVLPGGDQAWHAYRLTVVRGFAIWLATIDPDAQVPPAQLIPSRKLRATPYLYADEEIAALIAAAGSLRFPLRTATYQTLVGLLAVTGMRVGEAINLDREDIDLDAGVLTIREAKHGKSRLIPLHDTTVQALRGYLQIRDRLLPGRRPTRYSSPLPATGCCIATSTPRGSGSPRRQACGRGRRRAGRASMTCDIHSRSAVCWTPTRPGGTGRPRSRYCRPSSVMSTPPPRIGTSPRPRS